jgi:hypothetical protein
LINQINSAIGSNPEWSRTALSKHLCDIWGWKSPDGQPKDISCRDMLRGLDEKGHIALPARRRVSRVAGRKPAIARLEHAALPINSKLCDLQPLEISIASDGGALGEFKSLLDQYHYLGYGRAIGENIKYIVRANSGAAVACLLFGSAAWSCRARDEYIGWDKKRRSAALPFITNNTRYLVLPWVRVPHMASHILGLVAKRISGDWERRYGHGLLCLETFVEEGRFSGTCYKAANWKPVGRTTGRGRNSASAEAALPAKRVFLFPLARDFREQLTGTR